MLVKAKKEAATAQISEYTKTNALATGSRQVCEGERDRINAKRIAKNDSPKDMVAA